jgi:hypothetical protein
MKVLQKLWLHASIHTISHLLPRHIDLAYHYSVIPREKSQFNQSGYKIVPCSDVTGNEDENSHSRERVHARQLLSQVGWGDFHFEVPQALREVDGSWQRPQVACRGNRSA